ncbi:SMYD [Lepeophtheirus salmonis]|uniref:SMYD n=1 Tax=Lepeophtheirus salmonis TaxID=72036 RepID=A0A7R8H6F5_LEPSM|nr:SMYD [Lepeophtheirus salmonis]CAF2900720.1 SMYD [Lepeophtheirus salmonis]
MKDIQSNCDKCSERARFGCPCCNNAFYCSSACHESDWERHQYDCTPYTIHFEDRVGRLLIANRDIEAGEILFEDKPGAIGPDNNPKPCCLGCYKRMTGMCQYYCSKCDWPLCSVKCETGSMHERECSFFQLHKPKFNINDFRRACPSYNSIMTLRALWLRENDSERWIMIDKLMDHLEAVDISSTKMEVVDFIRDNCKLTQFSEKEILHVLGIIDTNAYIVGENPNKDIDIQGVYPITSILNHSCTGNTLCYALEDYTFVCRAVTSIKRGEELTTNYLHYHYHFFGSSYRLKDCASFWHFRCSCKRCTDSTEFNTNVDAIVCQDCAKVHGLDEAGYLLPMSTKLLDEWWDTVDNVPKYDVPLLERKHHELINYFKPSHYYVMEIKRRLITNIGETKGYEIESVARPWLEKKIEYCREHFTASKTEALYYLTIKDKKLGSIDIDTAISRMEEVAEHLLVVISVWDKYRKRSDEQKVAENARKLLEKVDNSYLHRNYALKLDEGFFCIMGN